MVGGEGGARMRVLGTGERRRTRVGAVLTTAGALVAFQALAIVGAGVASAVSQCQYNLATDTVTVTSDIDDDTYLAVETAAEDEDPAAPPGAILFSDGGSYLACGSATNSNTVAIVVHGNTGDEFFTLDEWDAGRFATTISWAIDLGTNGSDEFQWWGSDGTGTGSGLPFDDTVVVTDSTFNLNGAVGELAGVERVWLYGGDGDDTLDGAAMNAVLMDGSSNGAEGTGGDDFIALGTGSGDIADGGDGEDTL